MIKIDNVNHKATWLQGLEQSADILNGEGSGRLQGSGKMYLEYVGTFINHKGTLRRDSNCTDAEWNALFLTLINPKNDHTVSFPFGVNQTLIQKVYISQVVRSLKYMKDTNTWEKTIDVSFVAQDPAWTPNGTIKGLI